MNIERIHGWCTLAHFYPALFFYIDAYLSLLFHKCGFMLTSSKERK